MPALFIGSLNISFINGAERFSRLQFSSEVIPEMLRVNIHTFWTTPLGGILISMHET